jgi:carbamoyl-phosphate synthase large subunit
MAAGNRLPDGGAIFFSLADRDKQGALGAAVKFAELGFSIAATEGTAAFLEEHGVVVKTVVGKVGFPSSLDAMDAVELIASGEVRLVVNTPRGRVQRADGMHIRHAANLHAVPCVTTVAAARAAAAGIADWAHHDLAVRSLQEFLEGDQLRLPL